MKKTVVAAVRHLFAYWDLASPWRCAAIERDDECRDEPLSFRIELKDGLKLLSMPPRAQSWPRS